MTDYADYPLLERIRIFASKKPVLPEPKYAIMWEASRDFHDPVRVNYPSPVWMAMALHGGILPPVEVYLALQEEAAQPGFKSHKLGHLLHETPPIGPMTEEEAMEYLVMKDIPTEVWRDYTGNRKVLKIVPRNLIPTDRTLRNSWRIAQGGEGMMEAA